MVVQRAVVSSAPLAGLMMIASPVGFMCDDVHRKASLGPSLAFPSVCLTTVTATRYVSERWMGR